MKRKYPAFKFRYPEMELGNDEVHIWCIPLEKAASQFPILSQKLSMDEHMRAERFHFEGDRNNYILCRGILRSIIGCYSGIDGSHLRFSYGKHGKPALADMSGNETIYFNVSHSEDFALYAFTRNREIGIDIECIRDIPDMEQIIERIFSAPEKAVFNALPEGRKKEVFFQYWTRKEALLKAAGNGLYHPLDSFDVSLPPGESSKFLNLKGDSTGAANWQIQDLSLASGFAAAYAVEGASRMNCCCYSI